VKVEVSRCVYTKIRDVTDSESDAFSEIHRILKIRYYLIRNCCAGPTLQVWITVHWLMERSVVFSLLFTLLVI